MAYDNTQDTFYNNPSPRDQTKRASENHKTGESSSSFRKKRSQNSTHNVADVYLMHEKNDGSQNPQIMFQVQQKESSTVTLQGL